MKVLLIQPPVRDFYQTRIRTQPIGLAYLAAALRQQGFEVGLLDAQTRRKVSIPLPPEFSHLRPFYPVNDRSPFCLYRDFYHFGMGWEEIRREIEQYQPRAVGISSLFTPYHGEALAVARMVKEGDPTRMVIMGGPHVSGDPEGVLGSGLVDYGILGEGEIRFPRLLKALSRGRDVRNMEGMAFWDGGRLRINPIESFIADVDALPWPARDLLHPDAYCIDRKRSTMLITSRGCPHHCAYCSAHLVMGNRFRGRSPEAVVAEMKECLGRYNITSFDLEDDNFTCDLARAKQLMRLIMETFGERTLCLSAMNGVSFASLDPELLELMYRAGFDTLNLSFVSSHSPTRDTMQRPMADLTHFDRVVTSALHAGLRAIAYAIFGLPGQTIPEMVHTLVTLMKRPVLLGPSIYYPSPGTALLQQCKGQMRLPPHPSQWRSSAFPVETATFDRLDLVTLFRLTRLVNFLKGRMDQGEILDGCTLREFQGLFREKGGGAGASWPDLVRSLLDERCFFSLKRDRKGPCSIEPIPSSPGVMDCFLEQAMDVPILKAGFSGGRAFSPTE